MTQFTSMWAAVLMLLLIGDVQAQDWRNWLSAGTAAALKPSTVYDTGLAITPVHKTRFVVGVGVESNCVTDRLTGLTWLRNPDSTKRAWSNATLYCEHLDGSSGRGGYEDWRLPGFHELAGLKGFATENAFTGVSSSLYWTGNWLALAHSPLRISYLDVGPVQYDLKSRTHLVWPVRGGHEE